MGKRRLFSIKTAKWSENGEDNIKIDHRKIGCDDVRFIVRCRKLHRE
jgi:hypothetical protein